MTKFINYNIASMIQLNKHNGVLTAHYIVIILDGKEYNKDASFTPVCTIACGGSLKKNVQVIGLPVQLRIMTEVFPEVLNDHAFGCSKLDYSKDPDLVKAFADRVDHVMRSGTIYAEGNSMKIIVDRDQLYKLCEGYIPVRVTGKLLSGMELIDQRCVLSFGNCV